MILKVKEIGSKGIIFEGKNGIELSNKARVINTRGMYGYGVVRSIHYENDNKIIDIIWGNPPYAPNIKIGDEIKFTRQ